MKAKIQHEIQEYYSLLKLNAISEHFEEAITTATDYEGFLHQLLRMEVDAEEECAKERKITGIVFSGFYQRRKKHYHDRQSGNR